ncbi:phosphatidylinositol phosphate synthase [Kibdelosporangium phytohabitans]|uniref:Phosphatidylinositol phosphate synthase n=1 Tax=Kibdelosporangium phytohabitans TaxID=860235 RepID=A0A0N9I6T5_9PSEU|nr:CDP-alcohol phosphatidyltransferase family protein [Kibdelosporangium phytohabitans]ALG11752.1 phosphatidylglycerophosphate synthase [Kibdelosporangium phytohabitans]MBE1463154.1 CDP-diacylglycerol--glycerol-3-phosphate 3-phosphatidyltransferase [Kibdelosporangium phytohabitans]
MLNIFARASVNRVTDPMGAWLVRIGLTPNAMTVIGTLGAVAGAVWFFPRGQLVAGTFVVWGFAMLDLLDGAMARAKGGSGTKFGAVLDSSCDRIADGTLGAAVAWYCLAVAQNHLLGAAALICLVSGQVISYVKARAESTGLTADVGIVERAERLIITLVGTGLYGLGVPYALHVALWLLAVLSVVTVIQRLVAVWQGAQEANA